VTVGVGEKLDMTELEGTASAADPKFVIQIQSFIHLPYVVTKVAASTCTETCQKKKDCFKCKKNFMVSEEGFCVRDHCDSNPCRRLKGSRCVNVDNFYQCECPEGFYKDNSRCKRAEICPSNQMFSRKRGKCVFPANLGAGCRSKADIVFVIDGSSSVRETNFKKTLTFLETLAKQFPVGPDANRFAAIQFSSSARMEFDFNDNLNDKSVLRAIAHIRYLKGGTSTGRAIDKAIDVMQNARADAVPIIIVLTDGRSNNQKGTLEAAARLKRETKCQTYAVGIGKRLDHKELRAIASTPENEVLVHGFDGLEEIVGKLALSACDDAKDTCQGGNCISCRDGERVENNFALRMCALMNPASGRT